MNKPFDQLTETEIASLSDEEIVRYVDLACAERGVPLLPPNPGARPVATVPKKDVITFGLGNMCFCLREDAEAVAAMASAMNRVRLETSWRTGSYESVAVGIDNDPVTITVSPYYAAETWEKVRERVNADKTAREDHDRKVSEYVEAQRVRDAIASEIQDKRAEVLRDQEQRDYYRAELSRYLDLADGNLTMARRFLIKARPQAEKYLPEEEPATSTDEVFDRR